MGLLQIEGGVGRKEPFENIAIVTLPPPQARIQGAGAPPPLELLGRGQGRGTIWQNNCQNSLKTRLKYIEIT